MHRLLPIIVLAGCVLTSSAAGEQPASPLDFNRDIRPLLSNNCFRCHGPDEENRQGSRAGGLRLDLRTDAIASVDGVSAIVPGAPEQSELWKRIQATDPDLRMPPPGVGRDFTDAEKQRLARWIREGAVYARHWSYEPPVRPPVPSVKTPELVHTPIDNYVLARLEGEGLIPEPEADRRTLIRRVTLDLTGLPPSVEDVEAFVADADPKAYERLISRLLQNPAYGEHWARGWLDLARYADSAGYADDPARTIWAYRDYVIRSFQENKPFDVFTVEQLAGDLLPRPTEDQLIATAFHRNTLTNNEGGTNDEEFRNVAIVDRVNTTFAVWMGTTINCSQCHTHKYDPLTQKEYFQVFAIFNQSQDADRRDESPLYELWNPTRRERKNQIEQRLAALRQWVNEPASATDALEASQILRELTTLKPETTVPVMKDLASAERRTTKIQLRGNWQVLGDVVSPGVPAAFHTLPAEQTVDRLALARWLIDRGNPLTARVIVNRMWEQLFGIGLVATSEEFGSQGEPPTHPELLDWLAVEFMESGWNWQHMVRLMVESSAYRRSSRVTPETAHLDPDNRLLARGPRFRMSAEMVRDQALAVSGLLSHKRFGPPVRPPQPRLGVSAAFGSAVDWQTSEGEDRYRRALYTQWRRSNPYPSLTTFDAPNREVCVLRRDRTNTPLQALVTLNDPVYLEAAIALAKLSRSQTSEPEATAELIFRRALLRPALPEEQARLVNLYRQAAEHFAEHSDEARKLLQTAGPKASEGGDVVDLAAWSVVTNTVLNLDEMLMRP